MISWTHRLAYFLFVKFGDSSCFGLRYVAEKDRQIAVKTLPRRLHKTHTPEALSRMAWHSMNK